MMTQVETPTAVTCSISLVDREALYAEFRGLAIRLVRRYGEDADLRHELPGEIYCRFCTLVDAYDPSRGIPLRPYLVRGLTSSIYTYARTHWRRLHREVPLEPLDVEGEWFSSRDFLSEDVVDKVVKQSIAEELPQFITRLPSRQRQAVIWRYYEQQSFLEIARRLEVRESTARSLLRYAVVNLRKQARAAGLLDLP